MKLLIYKNNIKFFLFLFYCSSNLFCQNYITWTPTTTGPINGTYPLAAGGNGIATVTTSSNGGFLATELTSPSLVLNNLNVASGDLTFSTKGPNDFNIADDVLIRFSTPVLITRLNIADIDQGTTWNDTFNFSQNFINWNSILCISNSNGAQSQNNGSALGGNQEFANWYCSGSFINSFRISYARINGLTTAFLSYSIQVISIPIPQTFCQNDFFQLPTQIGNGITGHWISQSGNNVNTVNTHLVGFSIYTFIPDSGQALSCNLPIGVYVGECCQATLTSATTIDTEVHEERSDWIKSSDIITYSSAFPGNGVVYKAENFVELNEGFETSNNANFAAYIDACLGGIYTYKNEELEDDDKEVTFEFNRPFAKNFILNKNSFKNEIEVKMIDSFLTDLKVYSIDGRLLLEKYFNSASNFIFNTENLPKGVYILNMKTSGGNSSEKFILE